MKVPFTLGTVGHFGLAVASPSRSAEWFKRALGLSLEFEFEDGVAVGNANVTIALFKGKPSPETIGHMSFHLPSMAKLRRALEHLKRVGVEIEDPGDEIGPEAPGSGNMGLWFHDPDGYRWELSVLGAQKQPRRKRPATAAVGPPRYLTVHRSVRERKYNFSYHVISISGTPKKGSKFHNGCRH